MLLSFHPPISTKQLCGELGRDVRQRKRRELKLTSLQTERRALQDCVLVRHTQIMFVSQVNADVHNDDSGCGIFHTEAVRIRAKEA